MTTTERHMTDFTTNLHDAIDLRLVEDREPDSLVDPQFEGMAWPEIVNTINLYAAEEALYWENERELLAQARYDEYWA